MEYNKHSFMLLPPKEINRFYNNMLEKEKEIIDYNRNSISNPYEIAELRYGSKYKNNEGIERYLRDNKAIKDIEINNMNINKEDTEGITEKETDYNFNNLFSMDRNSLLNTYNRYSNSEKDRLSLLNIDNEEEYADVVDLLNKYEKYETSETEEEKEKEKNNILKHTISGVGVGAIAGGVVGSIVPGAGTIVGAKVGAVIGGAVGGGSEVLTDIIDNEVLEGVRNAKRNFSNAVNNTTVGMTSNAISGIGNFMDTIAYNIGGENFANKSSEINPFNIVGGFGKGISDYITEEPTREYSGVSKFFIQDLPSVSGSIVGFMAMGKMFGALTKGKAIGLEKGIPVKVAKSKVALYKPILGFGKGTTYAELSTRSVVALSEMDQIYQEVLEKGGNHNEAFYGGITTGGMNWMLLSATKAIPGQKLKLAAENRYSDVNATYNIIKGLSKEMLTEGFEEVGQLFSTEVGRYVGTRDTEFSDLKQYGEVAYLGAIGGLIGGGLQYSGAKQSYITQTFNDLDYKTRSTDLFQNKYKENLSNSKNKIEAMDKTIKYAHENNLFDVRSVVADTVRKQATDELLQSSIKTIEKINEYETTAKEKISDLGLTESDNLSKAMILEAILETTPDNELRTELEKYNDLYLKTDTKNMEEISNLNIQTKNRLLNEVDTLKINRQLESTKNKVYNMELFNQIDNITKNKNILDNKQFNNFLSENDLSYNDIGNMQQIQVIDQKDHAQLSKLIERNQTENKKQITKTLENKSLNNLNNLNNYLKDNKLTLDQLLLNNTINHIEYLELSNLLGKEVNAEFQELNDSNNELNKLNEILDRDIKEDSVSDINKKLSDIENIEKILKDKYGNLNNVPIEMLKDLGLLENDISLDNLKQVKAELKQQKRELSKEKKVVKDTIKQKNNINDVKTEKDYYKNEINQEKAKIDNSRGEYYNNIDSEYLSLQDVSDFLKKKHNIVDAKDYIVNNFMSEQNQKDIANKIDSVENISELNNNFKKAVPKITSRFSNVDIKAIGVNFNPKTYDLDLTSYYDGEYYNDMNHDYIYDRYQLAEELLTENKNKLLEDGKQC